MAAGGCPAASARIYRTADGRYLQCSARHSCAATMQRHTGPPDGDTPDLTPV
ncbi:hypothetical protein KCP70_04815 [Salmonella enterica subsp. enterica]|nr:hypothetical protein KCP70_04815 [Salmonella enterica subsp. enterica]